MPWDSKISTDSNDDYGGAIVHLVNENSSWHGHTMVTIEYSNGTFWGMSFQPHAENLPMQELITGTRAQLVTRTGFGSTDAGIIGNISLNVLSYVITAAQANALHGVIAAEQIRIANGTTTYATIGVPLAGLLQSGYRDTCYSWAVRILREAGIISQAWVATRWFSMAPGTAALFGKQKRL